MGLSSKMLSSDGLDWKSHNNLLQDQAIMEIQKPFSLKKQLQQNQQQQQKMEQLKCPRCDSTNTKFCYYNNYNKSQPRHFCKTCKRHWTKGGTLRNVPVGGGRKNKRPKTSSSIKTAATTTAATTTSHAFRGNIHPKSINNSITNQAHQQSQSMPLASSFGGDDQKGFPEILYRAFMCPPYPISQPDSIGCNEQTLCDGSITVPLSQDLSPTPQLFPFLGSLTSLIESSYSSIVSSSSAASNSSASQCSSSNILCNNNTSGRDHHFQAISDSTITSVVPTTVFGNVHQDHQQATWNLSNSIMDMSVLDWNLDDIDTLVSTNNPNMSWDNNDSEIKP